MSKYQNIKDFLELQFIIITTSKEFYKTKKIEFQCSLCYFINSLTSTSYSNKKCKISLDDFCTNCKKEKELKIQKEEFIKKIKEKNGHLVKEVDFSTRKVIYLCFTCHEEKHTFVSNLERSLGICSSCQNDKFKLKFDDIKNIVESHHMILITKKEEYKNNKQKLELLCKCGESYQAVLSDIKKDKHCTKCKLIKCKETCLERYGEDNVSKVPYIYEKIVETSLSRKSFEFPISKKVVWIMGYEPQAILFLLNRELDPYLNKKLEENDIIIGKDIKTFHYKDENNIDHVYFPDIEINNTNHIIEVKSNYTFYKEHQKNYLKFKSVINNGSFLRLMIYNEKKILYEFICKTIDDLEKVFNEIDQIKF
jgi:nicotinamidase-related amidase